MCASAGDILGCRLGGETLTVRFCLHPWQGCGLLGIKEAGDVQRRHFFTREVVEDHQIIVPYVESSKNLADFFTKLLLDR